MMTSLILAAAIVTAPKAPDAPASQQPVVVATDAYTWRADTIFQGPFKAYAKSPDHIISDYSARPGYFMPVEKEWKRKNDLSKYPRLISSNKLLEAVFNMGLDEMVNAVEPDTTLRTGKEWAGVWTRDVSYSIILSMAYMQPQAAMISLMKKVNSSGQIIQDTGSGGAWPISTDRMVWALAAWEIYKVTGDKEWLKKVLPIIERSVAKDRATIYSPDGLVMGETSFIDWREQSYPKWMQTADIARSEAMNTNMVHAASLDIMAKMALQLGRKKEAKVWEDEAKQLAQQINSTFWQESMGDYAMYTYGRDNLSINPRYETLGSSLAILYDIASPEQQKSIVENHPVTPFGSAIFFPQIADMPSYHNNALWPFVASYWALANAKARNERGTLEAIGSVVRPAALFATNKENFNLDNGDIFTELNSSNMLWSLSGNIALTTRILFGIHFEPDGLRFSPFVPKNLADRRMLRGFYYRGANLDITVDGYGDEVKQITLNGKKIKSDIGFIPAKDLKGNCNIVIEMANNDIAPLRVNHTPNVKAPITPIARLSADRKMLEWNPIEYIGKYEILLNGQPVGETRATTWDLDGVTGEWQIVGISDAGVPSFASEPIFVGQEVCIEMPDEKKTIQSKEVSYPAKDGDIYGFFGNGFLETDKTSGAINIPIEIVHPDNQSGADSGQYAIVIRYANGNGPVNTENKAAIRTLLLDGKPIGTIVMPTRGVGNWYDWGMTNSIITNLPEGKHILSIDYLPQDENMNLITNHALIDRIVLRQYSKCKNCIHNSED